MNLKFLELNHLYKLEFDISINLINGKYFENKSWIDDYFKDEYALPTTNNIENITLLTTDNQKEMPSTDIYNCKIIYNAMKELSLDDARNKQIWTYLTHSTFWEYMRKRWPMEGKKFNSVKTRYFVDDNIDRGLMNNGISRLWWLSYYTYDESYDNPYHLTELLLTKQDLATTLFARSFCYNSHVLKCILKCLDSYCINNDFPSKNFIRDFVKDLHEMNELKKFNLMPHEELYKLISNSLNT